LLPLANLTVNADQGVKMMCVSMPKWLVSSVAAVVWSAAATLANSPADAAMGMGGFRPGGFGGFHGGMGGFGGFHGPAMGGFRPGGFGGFHGGMGGFGGFHGPAMGGFRPGWSAWHGGAWGHPGWAGWHWHGGCWNCGHWRNGWWRGPAFASGLIVGAAATYPYWGGDYGYPYYGYDSYGYDNGCWAYHRVYNRYGHYIGRRLVNVCS
jgi:hypothetical protein